MSGKKGVFYAHHSSLSISCYPSALHNPLCQPLPLILCLASLDIEPGFEFTQLIDVPSKLVLRHTRRVISWVTNHSSNLLEARCLYVVGLENEAFIAAWTTLDFMPCLGPSQS
jgi:hypothetical protein